MKAVSLFIAGIAESFKSVFGKQAPHTETEEDNIDMDVFKMTDSQYEAKRQNTMLELETDYTVNVFTKWLFLALFICIGASGLYFLIHKSIMCMPVFALSFILYKLYENRKVSAETKHSFISFLLLDKDDLDKVIKTF